MKPVNFAIIGAGFIARVIGKAIEDSEQIKLVGVLSRTTQGAVNFANEFNRPKVYQDLSELLSDQEVDAVYLSTPTSVRSEYGLAVLRAGKHLLAEKPFISSESLREMLQLAKERNLAFMDATHFTHHPRTQLIRETCLARLGTLKSLKSSFFFPSMDRENIRFNPKKEPTGAVGDMGWYSMRAICEYLPDRGELSEMKAFVQRDEESGSITRGAGMVRFSSGTTSTFDFGYCVGAMMMNLEILGSEGVISVDDFVLDFHNSFVFKNPDHKVGFQLSQGVMPKSEASYFAVDSCNPQQELMLESFVSLIRQGNEQDLKSSRDLALETQVLLDAFCVEAGLF